MRLTLLGTGTPAPSARRVSSGYLLEIGGDKIVLDHGPGAAHRLLEAGHNPVDVTHAFFTHLHFDHIVDYPRLVLQRWDHAAGHKPELLVYGPAPMARLSEQLFAEGGVYDLDLTARTNFQASLDVYAARGGVMPRKRPTPQVRELGVGDTVEGNGLEAIVGQAVHFQPYLECFAYRFESHDGVVVYSGDNGGVREDMIDISRGCDVLIHMCHFMVGTEPNEIFRQTNGGHLDVAEIAKRAQVKTLVLTHMPSSLDEPGVIERMVHEMHGVFSGNIIVGRDLLEVPVKIGQSGHFD